MKKLYQWTVNNKFATILIFVLLLIVVKSQYPIYRYMFTNRMYGTDSVGYDASYPESDSGFVKYGVNPMRPTSSIGFPVPQAAPNLGIRDRKVITDADMSLQVESVSDTINSVKGKVTDLGGYVLNVNVNKPEFGESATLSVRVPSDKVEEFTSFARTNAVKVVSENMYGSDLTDQYVDTETRLAQLRQQLTMLQNILQKATTVEEIMQVQPYITSTQAEIDNLVGQNRYIDASAQSSRITLFLSTDELSLPYTPDMSWRPQAIFKNAVRSLLVTLQQVGSALIWLGVYSVLIVPALTVLFIIYLVIKRRTK